MQIATIGILFMNFDIFHFQVYVEDQADLDRKVDAVNKHGVITPKGFFDPETFRAIGSTLGEGQLFRKIDRKVSLTIWDV